MVRSEPTVAAPHTPQSEGGPPASYELAIGTALRARSTSISRCLTALTHFTTAIAELSSTMVQAIASGHKILVAGNGGSAAEAQHLVAELVGRFQRERNPFPAIALTTDTSILTAIANDYGYDEVFSRQVRALGQPGDVFIALSTSGESRNLLRAIEAANALGLEAYALTGWREGPVSRLASCTVRVPSDTTAEVQEVHSILIHLVCEIVEKELAPSFGDEKP